MSCDISSHHKPTSAPTIYLTNFAYCKGFPPSDAMLTLSIHFDFFFFFFFFKFKFWFDYYLHTIYLGKLCPHQYFVHTLSPVTDNCPSWISGRGRLTEEMISWSTSAKNWAGILTCGTWICSQMCYWVCYGAHPPYLSKFKTHWWTWLPSTDCASAGDVDTI